MNKSSTNNSNTVSLSENAQKCKLISQNNIELLKTTAILKENGCSYCFENVNFFY